MLYENTYCMLLCVAGRWPWGKLVSPVIGQLRLPVGEPRRKGSQQPATVVAAAAKPLQSCPTLCHPIDGSPPGSAIPGILQARTLEWVAIDFSEQLARRVYVCG